MNVFSRQKDGYDTEEVDSYIDLLKNDYEDRLAKQKDRIFYLKDQLEKSNGNTVEQLASVVERTRQIENSSKSIYELETQKLKIICKKLEEIMAQVESVVPENQSSNIHMQIQRLRDTIDANFSKRTIVEDSTDPVRKLLEKMVAGQTAPAPDDKEKPIAVEEKPAAPVKTGDYKIERKQQPTPKAKENIPTMPGRFENFLQEDVDAANFEKVMFNGKTPKSVVTSTLAYPTPNESGFDLKEAVNPKDDLDEIMKAFDFFDSDKKDN